MELLHLQLELPLRQPRPLALGLPHLRLQNQQPGLRQLRPLVSVHLLLQLRNLLQLQLPLPVDFLSVPPLLQQQRRLLPPLLEEPSPLRPSRPFVNSPEPV